MSLHQDASSRPSLADFLTRTFFAPFGPQGSSTRGRFSEFDGVRGWAALSVVLYHVFWETLYARAPEMRNIVTGAFMDGGLAVSIFFVLSAEAISAPFFQGKGDRVVRALALKRYSRLTIPILAATALTWSLAQAGALALDAASPVVGRDVWMRNWLQFPLTLPGVFRYSLVDVYFLHRPAQEWNPFLWTMGYELYGSFLVLAILLFARNLPGLRGVLLAGALYLAFEPTRMMQNFSCFLVGLLFADFRARGGFAEMEKPERQKGLALALGLVLLSVGIANYNGHHEHKNLKAFAMLSLLFSMPAAGNFFRNSVSQFLGRISFPMYLVQFAVIASPLSAAIGYTERHGGLDRPMAYLLGIAAVALTIVSAWAFLPVERLTARVGAALVRFVQGERPSAVAPIATP
jgi:peptidoglycan/LPS O-acetylase OafA/YrhL